MKKRKTIFLLFIVFLWVIILHQTISHSTQVSLCAQCVLGWEGTCSVMQSFTFSLFSHLGFLFHISPWRLAPSTLEHRQSLATRNSCKCRYKGFFCLLSLQHNLSSCRLKTLTTSPPFPLLLLLSLQSPTKSTTRRARVHLHPPALLQLLLLHSYPLKLTP